MPGLSGKKDIKEKLFLNGLIDKNRFIEDGIK